MQDDCTRAPARNSASNNPETLDPIDAQLLRDQIAISQAALRTICKLAEERSDIWWVADLARSHLEEMEGV